MFEQRSEQLSEARLLDGFDIVVCAIAAAFADHIRSSAFDEYYRELKYEGDDDAEGRSRRVVI